MFFLSGDRSMEHFFPEGHLRVLFLPKRQWVASLMAIRESLNEMCICSHSSFYTLFFPLSLCLRKIFASGSLYTQMPFNGMCQSVPYVVVVYVIATIHSIYARVAAAHSLFFLCTTHNSRFSKKCNLLCLTRFFYDTKLWPFHEMCV